MRLRLAAEMGKARNAIPVGIGFRDPVTPPARNLELPTLLECRTPVLRAYPPESVAAEKLETLAHLVEMAFTAMSASRRVSKALKTVVMLPSLSWLEDATALLGLTDQTIHSCCSGDCFNHGWRRALQVGECFAGQDWFIAGSVLLRDSPKLHCPLIRRRPQDGGQDSPILREANWLGRLRQCA